MPLTIGFVEKSIMMPAFFASLGEDGDLQNDTRRLSYFTPYE